MKLAKLLERLEYEVIQGTKEIEIAKVVNDSKEASLNSLFVCITGMLLDGSDYIEDAVRRGTVAVIVEKEVELPKHNITVIHVEDTRIALAKIAAVFYGYPAEQLCLIGVTGTKGKTTTTWMIREILEQSGHKTGLIGTIEVRTGRRNIPAEHTSPESLLIQEYLREMANAGCDTVVMEVSSQAMKLHRVEGLTFDIGVFTNIGTDHIGKYEHADFEEYKSCKEAFFRQCRLSILNRDDLYWQDMIKETNGKIETYGFHEKADYRISEEELRKGKNVLGMEYLLNGIKIRIAMPGRFNIYNSAAAYAVCRKLKVPVQNIKNTLSSVQVKGRVERIDLDILPRITVMIDYAHNAMSLQSVLEMIHSYNPSRIVTIFGCGGNRSKERRLEMGRVSGRLSDVTIITSDNPRDESPLDIMKDIRTGIEKTAGRYIEICDREEAVRYALKHAEEGEILLLAGKGHEDYQEIKGKKYHMDDREILRRAAEELKHVRRHYH